MKTIGKFEKLFSRISRSFGVLLFWWLYIPHILVYFLSRNKGMIDSDLQTFANKTGGKLPNFLALLFLLHNNECFRSTFYYRIGPVWKWLIGWWRPGCSTLLIHPYTEIGKGFRAEHAFGTCINADRIGDNFFCLHNVTIGKKNDKRPVIGNNVTIYAQSIVVGDIRIGNNAIVGAGSVVVKDVPDNAVVAGNPAKVIKICQL